MLRCRECGSELVFSARQRGDELCGPCSRAANRRATKADLARAAPRGLTIVGRLRACVRDGRSAPFTASEARELLDALDLREGLLRELGECSRCRNVPERLRRHCPFCRGTKLERSVLEVLE